MKASGKHKVSALRIGTIWLILAALLVVLSLVAINVGSAGYSVSEIVHALFSPEKSTVKVDRKSTRLNSSHTDSSRMPSSA